MARKRHYQKIRGEKISSKDILKERLEKEVPRIDNHFKRMLLTCALVTKALEENGIKPIVVGGFAVEFYTLGSYTTHDIDLVILEHQKADQLFKELGFLKEGRHWYHPQADVAIEAPASILKDADPTKITEVEVEGDKVYLIGAEDLILDRLRAGVYWKSTEDVESAKDLLVNLREQIDWPYLKKQAQKEEEVNKLLQEILGRSR